MKTHAKDDLAEQIAVGRDQTLLGICEPVILPSNAHICLAIGTPRIASVGLYTCFFRNLFNDLFHFVPYFPIMYFGVQITSQKLLYEPCNIRDRIEFSHLTVRIDA